MGINTILYVYVCFLYKKTCLCKFSGNKTRKKKTSEKIDLDVRLMHFCEGRTELPPTVPSQFLSLLSNLSKYKVIVYKSKSCGELYYYCNVQHAHLDWHRIVIAKYQNLLNKSTYMYRKVGGNTLGWSRLCTVLSN